MNVYALYLMAYDFQFKSSLMTTMWHVGNPSLEYNSESSFLVEKDAYDVANVTHDEQSGFGLSCT